MFDDSVNIRKKISRRIVLWTLLSGVVPAAGGAGNESMDDQVTLAVAALAKRLGVDQSRVEVVEVEPVTWPDASLGCPQPGMKYRQVPVDGYRILLRVDAREYPFHGGDQRGPFFCEHPTARPTQLGEPRPDT